MDTIYLNFLLNHFVFRSFCLSFFIFCFVSCGPSHRRYIQGPAEGSGVEVPPSDSEEGSGTGDGQFLGVPGEGEGQANEQNPMGSDFFIEPGQYVLAHDEAVVWDGCALDQRIFGGEVSDFLCTKNYLHPSFANHLQENLWECVSMAARLSGMKEPHSIYINHFGTYSDRLIGGTNRRSLHAYARAIDIGHINLLDEDGNIENVFSTRIENYQGANAQFYDEFRSCWAYGLPLSCQQINGERLGSIGHGLSVLGGNSAHDDHIHLSFPECP